MPKISELFLLILIACFVSMVLELNKFGVNLEKGIKKPNVIYISSALTSAIFGLLATLTCILYYNNMIIWIISDIIGTFLGPKSLKIICKALRANLSLLKNSSVTVLDEAVKNLDNIDIDSIESSITKDDNSEETNE